ncbi:MAG: hypothetical protein QNJ16_07110 [Rhodobacter sp.]|nr:hypothetical protein [Rhodobacter sp.]
MRVVLRVILGCGAFLAFGLTAYALAVWLGLPVELVLGGQALIAAFVIPCDLGVFRGRG